jgi:hypothetical protein
MAITTLAEGATELRAIAAVTPTADNAIPMVRRCRQGKFNVQSLVVSGTDIEAQANLANGFEAAAMKFDALVRVPSGG